MSWDFWGMQIIFMDRAVISSTLYLLHVFFVYFYIVQYFSLKVFSILSFYRCTYQKLSVMLRIPTRYWLRTADQMTQIPDPAVGEILLVIALAGNRCAGRRLFKFWRASRIFLLVAGEKNYPRHDTKRLLSVTVKTLILKYYMKMGKKINMKIMY